MSRKVDKCKTLALGLIRTFPEWLDVVVAVARKTDSREWPALFAHAGNPAALQRDALARGRGLHSFTFRLNSSAFCVIGGAFR